MGEENEKKTIHYNVGVIPRDDGKKVRVWMMNEAGEVCCANHACGKAIDKPHEMVSITFPPKQKPEWMDILYFCSWDCLTMFVQLNDDAMTKIEEMAQEAMPENEDSGTP